MNKEQLALELFKEYLKKYNLVKDDVKNFVDVYKNIYKELIQEEEKSALARLDDLVYKLEGYKFIFEGIKNQIELDKNSFVDKTTLSKLLGRIDDYE